MKWLMLIELLVMIGCFLLAWKADHNSMSRDEALGAIVPLVLGFLVMFALVITFIIWALVG